MKALILDWETTGIPDERIETQSYFSGPQGIQLGAVIVDNIESTWDIIDTFKSDVRYLGPYPQNLKIQRPTPVVAEMPFLTWDRRAYEIHGLSLEFLMSAPHPQEVGDNFVEWLQDHFGTGMIQMGGHVPCFDRYFMLQLLYFSGRLQSKELQLGYRMLDSSAIGYFLWGTSDSRELFEKVLGTSEGMHDALEDAILTAGLFREAKKLVDTLPSVT